MLVCGRFEGIDERVIAGRGLGEVSVGDYVLSGGEIAAMALVGHLRAALARSHGRRFGTEESFAGGLLKSPILPAGLGGATDPGGCSPGDRAKIAAWRRSEAERLTKARRPDLWERYPGHAEGPQSRNNHA